QRNSLRDLLPEAATQEDSSKLLVPNGLPPMGTRSFLCPPASVMTVTTTDTLRSGLLDNLHGAHEQFRLGWLIVVVWETVGVFSPGSFRMLADQGWDYVNDTD